MTSSGLLGPSSIADTSPDDLRKCFEANSMAPFFALKYAPPAMAKTTAKGNYSNAAPKDQKYGSIIVVSSVANTYGGKGPTSGARGCMQQGVQCSTHGLKTINDRMLGTVLHDELARGFGRGEGRSGNS